MIVHYFNGRLVDKADVPKSAILVKRQWVRDKWAGRSHRLLEKYYESPKKKVSNSNKTKQ